MLDNGGRCHEDLLHPVFHSQAGQRWDEEMARTSLVLKVQASLALFGSHDA